MTNNALVLTLVTILFFSCQENKPVIFINTSKLNQLTAHDTLSDFTLYNKGKADLIIEKYTSSCGCTVLELKENTKLKSQDSIKVPVKLKPSKDENQIYITFKCNTEPILTSFHFTMPSAKF